MATLPSNRTIDAVLLMAPAVHPTGPRGAFSIDGSPVVREPLHAERRGHQREPARLCVPALHRRRDSGSHGLDGRRVRRVRTICRRRRDRGHEVRRQHLQRLVPHLVCQRLLAVADVRRPSDPKRDQRTPPNPRTIPMYEATFGGPVRKERLWFFGATRIRNEETARTTADEHSVHPTNDEKRYEGKLTYAPRANHSMQVSYISSTRC